MSHIPKVIYFCNKTIIGMEKYTDNWKRLNPEYEIKLYDNEMCCQFLLEKFGSLYCDIFNYLIDGPIKADFWRVCILYIYGGVYSDIDNEPLVPIKEFIENNVDFVTCSSYAPHFNYNPNFIISDMGNIILKRAIQWYVNKFMRKDSYEYWNWSIMSAITQTLHLDEYSKEYGIYYFNEIKVQIIKECPGEHHYDAHNIYDNKRIFNNRYYTWNCETHSF